MECGAVTLTIGEVNGADSFVDQLNNAVGRSIAQNNPDASPAEITILVFDALKNGQLFQFSEVEGQENTFQFQGSYVDEKTYNDFVTLLNNMIQQIIEQNNMEVDENE